ncbi:helix-turn-helix transcriptional regulator [Treponema sp.]|uniref:helix-turn-helix domain-containing protein n=1 Tax=Treponema sp. TaxID=166 RepID=UPI00298E9C88|nr:helix-turn-helix transcriptional regulator [Treponema sp.]MCR5612922.1 helix-turn-helix domain-containing protein [Treponema sp.]
MDESFFADRLRLLRNERNISAREMSLELGQNESYINKIETGQRSIPMSAFFKICDFLNISPADFFDEKIRNTQSNSDSFITLYKQLPQNYANHIYSVMQDLIKASGM